MKVKLLDGTLIEFSLHIDDVLLRDDPVVKKWIRKAEKTIALDLVNKKIKIPKLTMPQASALRDMDHDWHTLDYINCRKPTLVILALYGLVEVKQTAGDPIYRKVR